MSRSNVVRKQEQRKMAGDETPVTEILLTEDETAPEEQNGTPPPARKYVQTENSDELVALISNTSDTIEVLLDIPEWVIPTGEMVQVLIRSLTAEEHERFVQDMQKVGFDLTKLYPDLVIATARHPLTKKPLFKAAHRAMLQGKIGRAMERMALVASDISGLSEDFLKSVKKS